MHDQPTPTHEPLAAPQPPAPEAQQPALERDEWFDEPETLPRRPRRRLLTPLPVALVCVLLSACGFIVGVLVEKGQGAGSSGAAGPGGSALRSRFAALRSAAAAGGAGSAASVGTSAGGAGPSPGAGFGSPAGTATVGQVAFVHGSTLYVTNSAGNTVKVKTSSSSKVTKTVSGKVQSIRPGEQVVISGTSAADGTVTASSIRVGSDAAGAVGGLVLPGGTGSKSSSGSSGTSSSSGPALFGSG